MHRPENDHGGNATTCKRKFTEDGQTRAGVIKNNQPTVSLFSLYRFCDFLAIFGLVVRSLSGIDRPHNTRATEFSCDPYLSASRSTANLSLVNCSVT